MQTRQPYEAPLQPYTLRQLALFYRVHPRTFQRWLRPLRPMLGQRQGHYFNIRQVELIFHRLGTPAVTNPVNN